MVVVDSDILIWLLRGHLRTTEQFKRALLETEGNLFITPVQAAEVYAGARLKEKAMIEHFFSLINVIPLDGKAGRLAGEFINKYGKSHNVTLADAMVAAASRINGCDLWTRNRKHYPMLEADEFFREEILEG